MEVVILIVLIIILLIRWAYLRDRLDQIDARISALSAAVSAATPVIRRPEPKPEPEPEPMRATMAPPIVVAPPPPPPELKLEPVVVAEPPRPALLPPVPAFTIPASAPRRSSEEWEALLGGNWLNKIGVFILVIGIALALAYSYKLLGPAGRVALSFAISLGMLAAGVVLERREKYRVFALGLIGGGWAALYFTVYAMHALEAARIIDSPWTGGILLLVVAVGMIAHSLRYRSQVVTGLAYFIAFATLAITQVTALSLFALVPLAASLLYIAHRFGWSRMAVFGLIATYAVCATRPDTHAPLWQAQTIFAVYWLLFEAFDIFSADPWLLPLNAAGFLGLSIFKFQEMAPQQLWALLAVTSGAYLAGAILRARAGKWHTAITLSAALAAVAMFLKFDHQWIALGLLLEGEALYLAGVRLRADYLRILAALVFGVELAQLFSGEVGQMPVRSWTPVAGLSAVAFYANRALRSPDILYGFAAAGLLALVTGYESPDKYRAVAWLALAITPFVLGWWRRLADFRSQAYLLVLLGLTGAVLDLSRLSLSAAAAVSYCLALCALLSNPDRFVENERDAVSLGGSVAAGAAMATLLWRVVPQEYLGVSWMAMALLLLELGLRGLPKYFCRQAYLLAAAGAALCYGPWEHRWIPVAAALLAWAMAARARREEGGAVLAVSSAVGTGYAMAALWVLLPAYAIAPAWMALALALAQFEVPVLRSQVYLVSLAAFGQAIAVNLEAPHRLPVLAAMAAAHYYLAWRTRQRLYLYSAAALMAVAMHYDIGRTYAAAAWAACALILLLVGQRWNLVDLRWQSLALAALAFGRCWYINFYSALDPILVGAMVIACLYAMQLLSEREGQERVYYSLLATTLTSLLPYYQVAGSLRTVVWGVEGMVLLGAGFPLRDRTLRLSGLALLLGCILKLFVWDLRHLDTGPRIISFLVLGGFLVGVSWVYTRFRERVAEYL